MATPIDFDGDTYGEPISDVDFRPRLPRTRWGWRKIMRQMVQEQILSDSARAEKVMHTSHGHHIPGTFGESAIPRGDVAKCGGVGLCQICTYEAEEATSKKSYSAMKPRAIELARKAQDLENAMMWDGYDSLLEDYKVSRREWLEFLKDTDMDLRVRLSKCYWLERDRGLTGH